MTPRTIRLSAAFTGAALLAAGVAVLAPGLRADDFKLKDGSKISGVIVGFDDNSFKVQTSYGFAIVRKDQIASIVISAAPSAGITPPAPTPAPASAPSPAPAPEPKPEPAPRVVVSPASNAIAKPLPKSTDAPAKKIAAPAAPVARASTLPAVAQPALQPPAPPSNPQSAPSPSIPPGFQATPVLVPAASASSANAPAPATVSAKAATAPPKPAPPEPIREEVTGTTYTNDTFHFRMYKPPTWLLLGGARAVLPQTIAALGTDNETTYVLIGQEPATKSAAAAATETQHRLVDVMQNFRPTDERQIQVGGTNVTERRFRGGIDDQDWSGIVVVVPHAGRLFTIFGMTRADSDLVQIQENILFRAISSLEFMQ